MLLPHTALAGAAMVADQLKRLTLSLKNGSATTKVRLRTREAEEIAKCI